MAIRFNTKYGSDQAYEQFTPTYRKSSKVTGALEEDDVKTVDDQWLIDFMADLGIALDRKTFEGLCETCTTCTDILASLCEQSDVDPTGTDEDNALIVLLELSHRWCPDWVSSENLDDLMQEGYLHFDRWRKGDEVKSLPYWERAWEMAKSLKAKWGVETVSGFDDTFGGMQFLSNWIQDYELELLNAGVFKAVDEAAHDDFIRDLAREFPAKEVRAIVHFQVDEDGNVVQDELDENGDWVDDSWMETDVLPHGQLKSKSKPMPAPRAKPQPIRSQKIGRNDPCPCGSGKKYKKCCGR